MNQSTPLFVRNTTILDWANSNQAVEQMIWSSDFKVQIHYFQSIADMLMSQLVLSSVSIVSTHISKSIKLPVVKFTLKNGSVIYIRNNFCNSRASFDLIDNYELFDVNNTDQDTPLNGCYFEGFEYDWVFPKYSSTNSKQFSFEANNPHSMFSEISRLAFFYNIHGALGQISDQMNNQ